MYDLVIIGSGPAGLMAGYQASKTKKVLIIERNDRVAAKIKVSGNGRCNLTNLKSPSDFLKQIKSNPKFLYKAINHFSPQMIYDFFESNGVALKVEENDKVFPQSNNSDDIIKCLIDLNKNTTINLNEKVITIDKTDYFTITTTKGQYHSNRVLIATGGHTYPHLGTTGDGYEFAAHFNHHIISLTPEEVAVVLNNDPISKLSGLTLENCEVKIKDQNNKVYETIHGNVLITHFGLSGPAIMNASSSINKIKQLGLIPFISLNVLNKSYEECFDMLQGLVKANQTKKFSNVFNLSYSRYNEYLLSLIDFDHNIQCSNMKKDHIKTLAKLLVDNQLRFGQFFDYKTAFVTGGGISIKEINPSTMESKLVPGLYFAGEIIDCHGLIGGYNITIALATGSLAAHSF